MIVYPVQGNGGATAVVTNVPFNIRFLDRGRRLLGEVGSVRRPARSRRLPPTQDPEPFTLERDPDRAVYAPLTFEVGSCWQLRGRGERACGPRTVTVAAPLGGLPYFVRAGTQPF